MWCLTLIIGTLVLLTPTSTIAGSRIIDAEIMEDGEGLEIPGNAGHSVRYAILHHKHEPDQATFAEWLRSHQSGSVRFVMSDGSTHQGTLHRLKHCFGRGLLLFSDAISLGEKAVVRLELPVAP